MRFNKKEKSLIVVFIAVMISTAMSFVRYFIFPNLTVIYTDENKISESVPDQFYDVLNNGL